MLWLALAKAGTRICGRMSGGPGMLSASEWSYLGNELDDTPRSPAVRIQIGVIDRQAPAGAAAALHSRRPDLGELPPGQPAGQLALARAAACRELVGGQAV